MGRWESTRKIKAFRGVWPGSAYRKTKANVKPTDSEDDQRIRELTMAKDEDAIEHPERTPLAVQQGVEEKYGVSGTQAKKQPKSTNEKIIEKCIEADLRNADRRKDREKKKEMGTTFRENLDTDDGHTEVEHRQKTKAAKRSWYTKLSNDRLWEIEKELGVEIWENERGELESNDPLILELIAEERMAADELAKEGFSPVNYKQQIESIIVNYKGIRINNRSIEDCNYITMVSNIREFYGIKENLSSRNNPLGNYRIFLNNFNMIYDRYRKANVIPSYQEIIGELNPVMRSMNKDIIWREAIKKDAPMVQMLDERAKRLAVATGLPQDIADSLSYLR